MAKNYESIGKKQKSVTVDDIFVSDFIEHMSHLQICYTEKEAFEPRVPAKHGKKSRAGLHRDAYIMTAKDLRTSVEEGGFAVVDDTYRDFIRLICVRQKIRTQKNVKPAYIIDASHLELGENSLINDKFTSSGWEKSDGSPLPVLRLITNSLDLLFLEQDMSDNYNFVLPQSELMIMRNEQLS